MSALELPFNFSKRKSENIRCTNFWAFLKSQTKINIVITLLTLKEDGWTNGRGSKHCVIIS